ncbi:hypothetical protein [Clostridium saudiense]|uniref:hypothetical protein n=1 Tax=Clostridium saudiense TaxID=1414720 RepID=UPI0018A924F4|nr:hypothetical protein [Clostridium saudiense]
MCNLINFVEEKMARATLEERHDMFELDVMCYVTELIENPSNLIIVKDNLTRDEDDELSEENILFIDSEREDYEELLWGMFLNNNKTIFNASFANNYNNSWMSVIYTYSGENLRIEKVS